MRTKRATGSDSEAVRAPEAMRYPATTPAGYLYDLAVSLRGEADEYYDLCPSWCEDAQIGHRDVETCDDDRNHYGTRYSVPIRSLGDSTEWPNDSDITQAVVIRSVVTMYLHRNVLHRDPMIWVRKNDSCEGFDLAPEEAEVIVSALISLAGEARNDR